MKVMATQAFFDLEKAYEAMFKELYESAEAAASKNKYLWANEQMKSIIDVLRTRSWRKYY